MFIRTENGKSYVMVRDDNGKLEKRTVTLGAYDDMTDTYAVTDGLSEADYVAYPDENCVEGAATTREKPAETIPEDGMNNGVDTGMNDGVDTGMINGGNEVG